MKYILFISLLLNIYLVYKIIDTSISYSYLLRGKSYIQDDYDLALILLKKALTGKKKSEIKSILNHEIDLGKDSSQKIVIGNFIFEFKNDILTNIRNIDE